MDQGIIEVDARYTVRSIRASMQGNAIKALVELITNCNDSYAKLDEASEQHSGTIEISYQKKGFMGLFSVRDYAQGMSIEDVKRSFKKLGSLTSGMNSNNQVRGYFGLGAKQALGAMKDGRICTFKDGVFVECKIFIDDKLRYKISDPTKATAELRKLHGIKGNGSAAYFEADSSLNVIVPQFSTVQESLANHYQLRKIMSDPNRKVLLFNASSNEVRRLRYVLPAGKDILKDRFVVAFPPYANFSVDLVLRRSNQELTQSGDDRDGGLLILDEQDAVLDISLFKYNNEPLANRFYGEVKINRFRELLAAEEAVLSDAREGLLSRHPFCRSLIFEIEKRLEIKVKEEAARKEQESQSKIDRDESLRYSKAFSFLNQVAETEAQTVINLGQELSDERMDPPNGLCLYPSSAQITVGKRYSFELRMNTKTVHHGSVIRVGSSSSKIRVANSEIKVINEDGAGIISKYVTIEGLEPNVQGVIRASVFGIESTSKVHVVPEKELLLSEGMVFQPESIKLYPNQPRRVYLLVYVKMIEDGSTVRISSDNETVCSSKKEIVVHESDSERHVAKYELEVWGESIGETAIITAECGETCMALLEVRVVSKEEQDDKGRKGMFSEPRYDYEPEPLQRTSYSYENGQVIIYVNFPSVQYYLGDDCQYKKTLPAQVFIADMVAERCFLEIAKKKVESTGAIRPEAVPDLIQKNQFELSRKYGKKVHEHLVDQEALRKSKSQAEHGK